MNLSSSLHFIFTTPKYPAPFNHYLLNRMKTSKNWNKNRYSRLTHKYNIEVFDCQWLLTVKWLHVVTSQVDSWSLMTRTLPLLPSTSSLAATTNKFNIRRGCVSPANKRPRRSYVIGHGETRWRHSAAWSVNTRGSEERTCERLERLEPRRGVWIHLHGQHGRIYQTLWWDRFEC